MSSFVPQRLAMKLNQWPALASLYLASLLLLPYSCATDTDNDSMAACLPIAGLDVLLTTGQVLLIGEIHGTQEGPAYVRHIACRALELGLSVSVGLELPQAEQEGIDTYLASAGMPDDQRQVWQLPFWSKDYQDGRTSQAIFELVEDIRVFKAKGEEVNIILIDEPGSSKRDLLMAKRVIEEAQSEPASFIIVLTGNLHNTIYENSDQMGTHIVKALGRDRVVSLNMSYRGGSAWVDTGGSAPGPVGLGGYGRAEVGIWLDERMLDYNGMLEVDSIHYSRPAKEWLAQ